MQVYAKNLESPVYQPQKKLVGFGRIAIKPGSEQILTLDVPVERLAYWDEQQKRFLVEPGEFELQIGASSEEIRHTQSMTVVPE